MSLTFTWKKINRLSPFRGQKSPLKRFSGQSSKNEIIYPKMQSNIFKSFVANIIESDLQSGKNGGRVVTRFPPEPNGYLHLGHAKSINLNFELAKAYGGVTHMRFDDTNPEKEDVEYFRSILDDVRWIVNGDINSEDPWFGKIRYASDYFPTIYQAAEYLIQNGMAYVDDLSHEDLKKYRGTLTESGINSPFRNRSIEENLFLFRKMKNGDFPEGHCILRAKIDMSHPNMNLRDPTLYRIKHCPHPMTGNSWVIYPMYDFAHAISDALENITHSLCTLEFENHRPLYDWTIDQLKNSQLLPNSEKGWRPNQYEFSRLNIQYTILSKRKLIQLVSNKIVEGWDDPRLPTISALRRRGFPSEALKLFCDRVGISKVDSNIDLSVLEDCAREILDYKVPRAFAIRNPLKIVITNWDSKDSRNWEEFFIDNHPQRPELGKRIINFGKELYISSDDFFDTGVDGSLVPPKGFKRFLPNGTVRLRFAYVITCDEVIRDQNGKPTELRCTYDPLTRAGASPENSTKAKGIIQWLSTKDAVSAQLNIYDRLFSSPSPGDNHEDGDFMKDLNPNSLIIDPNAFVEKSACQNLSSANSYQFERMGYFITDVLSSSNNKPVFNKIVSLKDTWAKSLNSQPSSEITNESQSSKKVIQSSNNDTLEDILRLKLIIGQIDEIEKHPNADNLYVSKVNCGPNNGLKTVISGLVKYYPLEKLKGRKVVLITNLKPIKMKGILSEAMILAANKSIESNSDEEIVEILEPPQGSIIGEQLYFEGFGPCIPDVELKSKSAQEVWKRVCSELKTSEDKLVIYKDNRCKLMSSAGPCSVPNLHLANVR